MLKILYFLSEEFPTMRSWNKLNRKLVINGELMVPRLEVTPDIANLQNKKKAAKAALFLRDHYLN
ncbi:hypothetical protein CN514_24495 [Bacillus sp. AFS001701]|nr:hypothetical protein CN514_24495 [Bacillus sp. AFS001701]